MLYIKDRFDVSGRAYHEMAKVCKEMPRHYKLKNRIVELNKLWNIRPTPNGTHGVQQSLQERLEVRAKRLVETTPSDAAFKVNRQQVQRFNHLATKQPHCLTPPPPSPSGLVSFDVGFFDVVIA